VTAAGWPDASAGRSAWPGPRCGQPRSGSYRSPVQQEQVQSAARAEALLLARTAHHVLAGSLLMLASKQQSARGSTWLPLLGNSSTLLARWARLLLRANSDSVRPPGDRRPNADQAVSSRAPRRFCIVAEWAASAAVPLLGDPAARAGCRSLLQSRSTGRLALADKREARSCFGFRHAQEQKSWARGPNGDTAERAISARRCRDLRLRWGVLEESGRVCCGRPGSCRCHDRTMGELRATALRLSPKPVDGGARTWWTAQYGGESSERAVSRARS